MLPLHSRIVELGYKSEASRPQENSEKANKTDKVITNKHKKKQRNKNEESKRTPKRGSKVSTNVSGI